MTKEYSNTKYSFNIITDVEVAIFKGREQRFAVGSTEYLLHSADCEGKLSKSIWTKCDYLSGCNEIHVI